MTVFYVVATLLVIAALLFIVPPLLQRGQRQAAVERGELNVSVYRDQLAELERDLANDVISEEQYRQSRDEIEQRLLEDVSRQEGEAPPQPALPRRNRMAALAVAIALPVVAIGLYIKFGTPAAIDNSKPVQISEEMSQQQVSDQINRMVAQLAARLEKDPSDGEGWAMLGRSYFALQRFAEAVDAFENAVALQQGDAQLYADFADALAMAGDQSLEGRPLELIRQALEIDPVNEKALWLAGTAAYERADFAAALKYWQKLYGLMSPGSEGAEVMEKNIAEARSLLKNREGADALAAVDAARDEDSAAARDGSAAVGGASVAGVVRVAAQLAARISASDTVFVFAQAPNGPRMPLAVLRKSASSLPLSFVLDDSMAMTPQMSLSRFDRVVITARVSHDGNARAQSGDLEGRTGEIPVGATGVEVVIDRVTP